MSATKSIDKQATATVLLIDDDQQFCSAISTGLSKRGYHPTCVFTMKEGIAHALQNRPDLIISDVCLNDGDGFHLLNAIF